MICGSAKAWPSNASRLCRIARQSSPRWRRIQYGKRRDGIIARTDESSANGIRKYSSAVQSSRDSSGSITTSTPTETGLKDILEQLPSHHTSADPDSSSKGPSLLLLLLTPAYAQHAIDSSLPLRVFEKLSGSIKWSKSLRTVTAVVDRIPDSENTDKHGREGLAYTFLEDGCELADDRDGLKEMSRMVQKPGWLEFEVARTNNAAGMVVQVPLARTIFSNGKVSTLVHALYRPDAEGQLHAAEEMDLETFRLNASSEPTHPPRLHAPLIPLTPARQMMNVMGNIVRTVSAEPSFSGSGKVLSETQPASEELEQAVTAYFAAADIQPQPVSVWALIIPSPLPSSHTSESESTYRLLGSQDEDLRALWASRDSSSLVDSVINHLLPLGARLRKVLSGGGGWGKKAGLLSLDPDDRYSTRELRQDVGWEMNINDDMKEQQRQALGEVAKAGESVMFFLAPEGLSGYEGVGKSDNSEHSSDIVATFGSLPSSIDTIPATAIDAQSNDAAELKYKPGFLGALTEEGVAVTMTDANGTVTKTKFDVPFSRIDISRSPTTGKPTSGTKLTNGRRQFSTSTLCRERAKGGHSKPT